MNKHTPTSTQDYLGGTQNKYEFPNGYGASVVKHDYSNGHEEGLWELAVLGQDGHLCYSTPITDDVIGWLTDEDVQRTLDQIAALKKPVSD